MQPSVTRLIIIGGLGSIAILKVGELHVATIISLCGCLDLCHGLLHFDINYLLLTSLKIQDLDWI